MFQDHGKSTGSEIQSKDIKINQTINVTLHFMCPDQNSVLFSLGYSFSLMNIYDQIGQCFDVLRQVSCGSVCLTRFIGNK